MSSNRVYLKDYTSPDFLIKDVYLTIEITEGKTLINSVMNCERKNPSSRVMILNGQDMILKKIHINGEKFDEYDVNDEFLTINIDKDHFELVIDNEICPEENTALEGLYKSAGVYCTQNEPEGFRKITYFLDRPDNMSKFKTKIIASKKDCPILLSNGNKIESGGLPGERHFAIWEDPFPKPSYLYALVAGNLACVKDTFTRKSGELVQLEIYVDIGNEDKCSHAMESLKKSMKWDEDVYGLEYDLNIYMIVAVDSFNMGAMENKGLNIFNSVYVLAKPEIATDQNFMGIEAVIGHEYFHNWTGNRVTCRDWFQLTLKEGLTVFRDQEFSADMLSRYVKRIEDVKGLREVQFEEDAGPLSHPIKPKSYIEMNNFYTATVYEKGAEVIRMIHTIIGADNFRKGMDLYFKRHDGNAVTTEDFISAMSDASGIDLEQFKLWYDQNGTPVVTVAKIFDVATNSLKLSFNQKSTFEDGIERALHMPIKIVVFNTDGAKIFPKDREEYLFHLNDIDQELIIEDVSVDSIVSLNRGFTSPIILNYENSNNDLIQLVKFDDDGFNKYESMQLLMKKYIIGRCQNENNTELFDRLIEAFSISMESIGDLYYLSYLLKLPSESELNRLLPIDDYETARKNREILKSSIAKKLEQKLTEKYEKLNSNKSYSLTPESIGRRALKNLFLDYLFSLKTDTTLNITKIQFENSTNMTDKLQALICFAEESSGEAAGLVDDFYKTWKHETLVMQKWFSVQALSSRTDVLSIVKNLEQHDCYDEKVPNLFRSLVMAFTNNLVAFNAPDGSGYKWVCDKIIEANDFNPQLASRLAKSLNHLKRLDKSRESLLRKEMERVLSHDPSSDVYEVISKSLA